MQLSAEDRALIAKALRKYAFFCERISRYRLPSMGTTWRNHGMRAVDLAAMFEEEEK